MLDTNCQCNVTYEGNGQPIGLHESIKWQRLKFVRVINLKPIHILLAKPELTLMEGERPANRKTSMQT